MLQAAIIHSSAAVAVCDHDFTVRFINPAFEQLIERGQALPHGKGALDGNKILTALGVDMAVATAAMMTGNAWQGIVLTCLSDDGGRTGSLQVAVEAFFDAESLAGWLITAREHVDKINPPRLSNRDMIMLSNKLTAREREVVLVLEEGVSNKVVAMRLNISPRTVEFHRARIMQRFAAKSIIDLIRRLVVDASCEQGEQMETAQMPQG